METLWQKLDAAIGLEPEDWEFLEGDDTTGPYKHRSSILGISFSPDGTRVAIAGGGCLPRADPTVRIIEVGSGKNIQTLDGHVCGIHDVSFDPQTGILASASFDYAVHLWNTDDEGVLYLHGEQGQTKGFARFSREGSLLVIAEDNFYDGPCSFYVYDLGTQDYVFAKEVREGLGVSAVAISPDSKRLAVAASHMYASEPAVLYIVDLDSFEISNEFEFAGYGFSALAFIDATGRLLAGVSRGESEDFEAGLIEISIHTGEITWRHQVGGIGMSLAAHPERSIIAIAQEAPRIAFLDTSTMMFAGSFPFDAAGEASSIVYSNDGKQLAFGTSAGELFIVDSNSLKIG